ncbi:MAG: hypothetical protein H7234_00070 [Herminiimonas sp.]|nr:hypothetical protein [Herminiimonas sp.]
MNMPFFVRILLLSSLASTSGLTTAQTMEDSSSLTFEAPFGMHDAGDGDVMVNGTRDSALNKVVSASPGWGFSATAMGNLVNVVTQGSNNTVLVNTSQINKGSQQAILATPLTGNNITGSGAATPISNLTNTGSASYLDLR